MKLDLHNCYSLKHTATRWLTIVLTMLLMGPVPAHAQQDKEFVDLFHKEWAGFHVISEEAQAFVLACCEDRVAAVELLTRNGFSVESITEPGRVRELNMHWKTEDEAYDEFIHATRGPGVLRFWRVFTSYRVVFFAKGGVVKRVYAVVDTTWL
jgi:hypothetical protein